MHTYLKYTEISVVKCKYNYDNSPNIWMFDISLNNRFGDMVKKMPNLQLMQEHFPPKVYPL